MLAVFLSFYLPLSFCRIYFPAISFCFFGFSWSILFLLYNLLSLFRARLLFFGQDHLSVAGRAHVRVDPTVSSVKSCAPSWGLCSPGCARCSGDLHPDPKVQHYCLWGFFPIFLFFGLNPVACCMFPGEGLHAHTLHWKGGGLTAGPPGNSYSAFLNTCSKNSALVWGQPPASIPTVGLGHTYQLFHWISRVGSITSVNLGPSSTYSVAF